MLMHFASHLDSLHYFLGHASHTICPMQVHEIKRKIKHDDCSIKQTHTHTHSLIQVLDAFPELCQPIVASELDGVTLHGKEVICLCAFIHVISTQQYSRHTVSLCD